MKLILFLLFLSNITANNEIDSLQKLLGNSDKVKRLEVLNKLVEITSTKNDTLNAIKYSDILVSEIRHSNIPGKIKYYLTSIQAYKKLNETEKFISLSKETLKNIKNFKREEFRTIYKLITEYYYYNGQYDNNIKLLLPIYNMILGSNSFKEEALFVKTLAQNYIMMGMLDSAFVYVNKNLLLRKNLKDTAALGHAYNSLGVIYWKKGDLYNAYLNYINAEKFCKAGNDTTTLLLTLNNLGLVFQRLKYYQKAEEYMQQGLVYAKAKMDYYGTAYAYRRLADLYLELNKFKEAKAFLNNSLEYYKLADRKLLLTDVYYLFGKLYQAEGKYTEALNYYNMGLSNKDKILDKFVVALLLTRRSEIYLLTNNYESALNDASEALNISTGNRYAVIQKDNYLSLYKINKALKEYQSAVNYLEKYNEIKEKILTENIVNLIYDRDIKNSIEKSTEISKRLKKENELQKTIINNNKLIKDIYGYLVFISGIGLLVFTYQLIKVRKLNKEIKTKNLNLLSVNNELIEKNKLLASANETKHKLFAIIAHDLKNPFFSIVGFANIIKEQADEAGTQEIKDSAEILLFSAQSLIDMIDNLSKWAKLQQENINPIFGKFDIKDEISNIVAQNSANIKLKNIKTEIYIESNSEIIADKEMTTTIIRNLISNAIKFTPTDGKITISCKKENSEFLFSVKDSGKGISQEMVESILKNEKINSVEGTNKEKGSGIGLAVCKDFIAAQKGVLLINGNFGTGAEFIVKLPLN